MAATNWRKVADALAERLANHAFCETHPAGQADDDCPFCRDRAAYRRYLAAGGTEFRDLPRPGDQYVTLAELVAQHKPEQEG